jgi:carbon-monoxide dehydrogenase large subunit
MDDVDSTVHTLRRDGDLLLSGRAEFLADIRLEGLKHAAVLRSPHAHARILAIRTAKALARPGVSVVLDGETAKGLAGPLPHFFDPAIVGCNTAEFRCLAVGKTRYVGEPVVAVVANSIADAEAALYDIEVDYEVLPPVVESEDALAEGAPLVFEDWGTNVLGTFPFIEGDSASAMASATHVLEDELRIQRYQTAPLETRGCMASWGKDRRLTFWCSTQNPHPLRTNLSGVLGVPEDRIHVIATRLGGGFGHKFNGFQEESLICVLSRLAGAPVRWLETRQDCLTVGAREYTHNFRVGFEDDGRVVAIEDKIVGNVGALMTWGGWAMTFPAGMTFPGPYKVLDYSVESVAVVTNKAPWSGARGYGKESACLALERMMDLVADKLGLDPVAVRMINFIPPDEFPFWFASKHLDSGDYGSALDKVLELADYKAARARQRAARAEDRLVGVGVGFELTAEGGDFANSFVRGFDTSTVRIQPTGAVKVLTGVTSPGTGNETSIAYVVARELGLDPSRVDVTQGDTDVCPYGYGSFTSRSLGTGAAAAVMAVRELRGHLAAAAAVLLKCDAGDIEFVDGRVRVVSNPASSLGFAEVTDTIYRSALAMPGLDQPVLEVTKFERPNNFYHVPDEKGRYSAYPSFPYSAHVAVVEVDRQTGVVDLIEYSAVHDCGVVISPRFVAGQLYGGITMGIGGALWEDLPYDTNGQPLVETFKHYLLPRATDLPSIRLDHQETPSPYTVLGTKGVGESGVGGALAAVANAVNDALLPLGVRARKLPFNGPNLLQVIRSAEGSVR